MLSLLRVILLLCVSTCVAAALRVTDLETLYDEHRWFELRDAIDETAPALFRGAVACVFNDGSRCEKTLRSVIQAAPRSEEAAEARGLLLSLQLRQGFCDVSERVGRPGNQARDRRRA
jgi:hypothetical protein